MLDLRSQFEYSCSFIVTNTSVLLCFRDMLKFDLSEVILLIFIQIYSFISIFHLS